MLGMLFFLALDWIGKPTENLSKQASNTTLVSETARAKEKPLGKVIDMIRPKRLSLVHHFTELLHPSHGLKNGAMVFALSRTGMVRSEIKSSQISDLLGEKGLSAVQHSTNILVPCYSEEELDSCLGFSRKEAR
ncbi:28S ribosomal protein S29, mitochondrial [Desmophyllum pertusum]|uniref:28S ribosomal protein S29, mitochondrial n=1 Tax=Desmophyllum pertusum TaxID=174260 RepID=A0A9W9YHG6_9CNID|nr:28S ribosomal protein S29, mitochondrial [Desmophyllum pertusum]